MHIFNFPWLSGDVPRLPPYGVYISRLARCDTCCTSVLDFHFKNIEITPKLLAQGYRYRKLRTTKECSWSILWALFQIWWNIVSKIYSCGNLLPVLLRWSSLRSKEGEKCSEFRFVGLDLRHWKYDRVFIERMIGIVLSPLISLYRNFLNNYTLNNKAKGTIWRDLSKPSQRRQGHDPHPLWLLDGTSSAFGPEFGSRRVDHILL